jgi:hypothetical protein
VTLAFLFSLGSRSGSVFALLLFTAIFGALGFLAARRLRRPRGGRRPNSTMPAVVGLSIVIGPLLALYMSSLDGFYDVLTMSDGVRLRYLVPAITADIRWNDLRRVDAVPQYRGTWRLRVVTAAGTFESATARRDQVEKARAQLVMSHATP